jgi:hypothetical protein
MIRARLTQVQGRVERLLHNHPDTRNNDLYLQWLYLMEYEELDMPFVKYADMARLSSVMESIRRCRQKIQNTEKKYPPTDQEIAKRRGWAEEDWRAYFSGKEDSG